MVLSMELMTCLLYITQATHDTRPHTTGQHGELWQAVTEKLSNQHTDK